jgi:small-conductance mechanosensitive channel
MPTAFDKLVQDLNALPWADLAWSLVLLLGAIALGMVGAALLFRALGRAARRTDTAFDDKVIQHLRRPLRWLVPLVAVRAVLPVTELPGALGAGLAHAVLVAVILSAGALALGATYMVEDIVAGRLDISATDNLQARSVLTRMRGFRNIVAFITVLLTVAMVLLTFEGVRRFGVTLLASAGVAGIVIGFAAQRSIATVVAGIQIAITQPIRIDDVVIVEGEWGRIEEISLTFVVVRLWDLRRLIVPITYFIERPFQNWTRTSAAVLGTVILYADYRLPVGELRGALKNILDQSGELWDGEVWGLQVTGSSERTLELRALMGSRDAAKSWDLRCLVRERLIQWISEHYPEHLPRVRAELHPDEFGAATRAPELAHPNRA